MNENTDVRVETARLQKEIKDMLGLSSDELIFEYSTTAAEQTKLDLITINPRHNQSFLFHSTLGIDKIDCLKKMQKYVKKDRVLENSYTVQWSEKNASQLQTSYFSAKNIYEALDKLYFGRDINTLIVYIVKLNPIT
jgi:hypothetical protein